MLPTAIILAPEKVLTNPASPYSHSVGPYSKIFMGFLRRKIYSVYEKKSEYMSCSLCTERRGGQDEGRSLGSLSYSKREE